MAEKVLFEYRVERAEGGYRYEFRRGEKQMKFKSSVPLDELTCHRHRLRFLTHRPGYHVIRPRRAARKMLDTLEQVYRDIYGNNSGGEG